MTKPPIIIKDRASFLKHWEACGGTEASLKLAEENEAREAERQEEDRVAAEKERHPDVGGERIVAPTISEMSKSLASSMVGWAKAGFALASDEVKDERLSICRGCEFWKEGKYGRCMKCGCSGIKLWLATERCPIGKWVPESTD